MAWTDKQLQAHKKAQAGLSAAGATLGVGALAAAGARMGAPKAVKLAQRAGRLKHVTPDKVKAFRGKATGISAGLTTGSAGVGGIGGFNFAGIQSAESKRSSKVAKREKFTPTQGQQKQIRRNAHKGEAIGTAAGLAATAAFPGVRRAAVGSAKLSRALYQGGKAGTSGGRLAIGGSKPALKSRLKAVGSDAKLAGSSGVKGAATGGLYMLEKHPKQALGAYGVLAAGSQGGSQIGHTRKRGELKRQQGYKTTFIKSEGGMDFGLGRVRQGEISKAYDPERNRAKRLDRYNAGANMGAGALGAASGVVGAHTFRQVRALKGKKTVSVPKLRVTGRNAAVTAALGIGAVGAAVGADRIKSYKRGNGRTYRPLHAQI